MHVLSQDAYTPDDNIEFNSSALLEIKEARKTETKMGNDGPVVPAWSLDVLHKAKSKPVDDVLVPRGSTGQKLDDYTDKMAGRQNWSELYAAKDMFAEVRYHASSTIHRCQGVTQKVTFVDVSDVNACWTGEEQALKYVAATRPEEALVLIRS